MALHSTFKERLEHMETTRNHRLSLLQAEKELQKGKSLLLSAKLASIRSMEQRCLILDHKLAAQNFRISSLQSHVEVQDRKYQNYAQQLRDLKVEVEELEYMEKEKNKFYDLKRSEMEAFMEEAVRFEAKIRTVVQELRNRINQLKSGCMEVNRDNSEWQNCEIVEAEMRKYELLATKQKLDTTLASNYRLRADLEKQLQSLS